MAHRVLAGPVAAAVVAVAVGAAAATAQRALLAAAVVAVVAAGRRPHRWEVSRVPRPSWDRAARAPVSLAAWVARIRCSLDRRPCSRAACRQCTRSSAAGTTRPRSRSPSRPWCSSSSAWACRASRLASLQASRSPTRWALSTRAECPSSPPAVLPPPASTPDPYPALWSRVRRSRSYRPRVGSCPPPCPRRVALQRLLRARTRRRRSCVRRLRRNRPRSRSWTRTR
mmetsp:Transcript_24555/g.62168  ORF Transcript_24555/g.62168 Transcript_24555/m.62168 type:complete len:227 (-) Transcript_24555:475-1155(-)